MKKLFNLILVVILMAACSPTPEQKVEKLVQENVKKTLLKPDTYDPIETKVDSAFSPFDDIDLLREVARYEEMLSKYQELEEDFKQAKSRMAIYDDSFRDIFFKNQYQEVKETYEETKEKYEKMAEALQQEYDLIVSKTKGERKFVGYKALHSFRANSNDGNTVINEIVFVTDVNADNISFSLLSDLFDKYQEFAKSVKERNE